MSEEQRQMTLEGYKNLSAWNDRDVQTLSSYDKIFIPVVITGWAISFTNTKVPSSFLFVYIGGAILLTFWILLSQRYAQRTRQRFCIMGKMECCLGFRAHKAIQDKPLETPTAIMLRWWFYAVTMILGAAVAVITPDKLKTILDCSWWNRVVVLIISLITLIIILAYLRKRCKKGEKR